MPLALTSPDGPAGARVELVMPDGGRQVAVLADVAVLGPTGPTGPAGPAGATGPTGPSTAQPTQSALNQDGTTSPIHLQLLAAPHAPGLYAISQYLQVRGAAGAFLEAFLGYSDEVGAQSFSFFTQGLGSTGIVQPPLISIFSDGSAPITIDLTIGGAVGPPLLFDYFASAMQTGT